MPDLGSIAPTFCANFHTNPLTEAFQHFEGMHNIEITGGIGVVCVHDPRSCQNMKIIVDWFMEGGSARTARVAISRWGDGNRFSGEQDSFVVSLEQAASCDKVGHFCGFGSLMRGNVNAKTPVKVRWSGRVGWSGVSRRIGILGLCLFPVTQ